MAAFGLDFRRAAVFQTGAQRRLAAFKNRACKVAHRFDRYFPRVQLARDRVEQLGAQRRLRSGVGNAFKVKRRRQRQRDGQATEPAACFRDVNCADMGHRLRIQLAAPGFAVFQFNVRVRLDNPNDVG